MVVRVAERARESGAARVVVATDDERHRRRGRARTASRRCITRADHPTGTDRLAEAAAQLGLDDDAIVVNVQGDEPLLEPALIRGVAELLQRHARRVDRDRVPSDRRSGRGVQSQRRQGRARRARLRAVLQPRADPVGARRLRRAARAALPAGLPLYRHTASTPTACASCARYPTLAPAPIERFEALEQLRALWHGYRIVVEVTDGTPAPGVDTPEDLERVRAMLAR